MANGILFLIPVALGDSKRAIDHLPEIAELTDFIVENSKSARRHIQGLGVKAPLPAIEMQVLDEHTRSETLPDLLAPLLAGRNVGLMSEAGCPGIADPGAALVELAHRHAIRVVPLIGPSAILLALMASGLNGQSFAFHGYLPSERSGREAKIRALEEESKVRGMTQICIEAPYRNQHLLTSLLECARPTTRLCLAANLTLPAEAVQTKTIAEWKKAAPDLHKQPTVFLFQAAT
ncbi:MAG: SAM-dependent methyltransferase [Burkholderiales bacterium]|nr:SAM-dependent methyltransferase [Burkholderiales bacterium]